MKMNHLKICTFLALLQLFNSSIDASLQIQDQCGLDLNAGNGLELKQSTTDYISEKKAFEISPNEREDILQKIRFNPGLLAELDIKYRMDPEIVAASVIRKESAIKYAAESLKNDRSFILKVIRNNSYILEFVDEKWKADKEIAAVAIEQSSKVFQFANESLQNDRDFVLDIIRANSLILEYVKESFKRDQEIVKAAITRSPMSIQYADESLQNDREFILKVVSEYDSILQYVKESFRKDREIVKAAIALSVWNFQFADESLRNDREFILEVVREYPMILRFLNEKFRKDADVVRTAVSQNVYSFLDADPQLQMDKDFLLGIIEYTPDLYYILSTDLKMDKEFFKKVLNANTSAFLYADLQLLEDYEVCLEALKFNFDLFDYIPESLKQNRNFVLRIVQEIPNSFAHLDSQLRKDSDIVITAITHQPSNFQFVDKDLKMNKQFIILTLSLDGNLLEYAHNDFKDDWQAVLTAIRNDPNALQFASDDMMKHRNVLFAKKLHNVNEWLLAVDMTFENIIESHTEYCNEKSIDEIIDLTLFMAKIADSYSQFEPALLHFISAWKARNLFVNIDILKNFILTLRLSIPQITFPTILDKIKHRYDQAGKDGIDALLNRHPMPSIFKSHIDYYQADDDEKVVIEFTETEQHFEESMAQLGSYSRTNLQSGLIKVEFIGQVGVDAGGLSREWFSKISAQMITPEKRLFSKIKVNDIVYYQPRIDATDKLDLQMYENIGKAMALAMVNQIKFELDLVPYYFKRLIGLDVTFNDLVAFDHEKFNFLAQLETTDIDSCGLTFSVAEQIDNILTTFELKEGGDDILVTESSKDEYIQLFTQFYSGGIISRQLNAMQTGFRYVVPHVGLIPAESLEQLVLLIGGISKIDLDELKSMTLYEKDFNEVHEMIVSFWKILSTFDDNELKNFVQYWSGSSRLPAKVVDERGVVEKVFKISSLPENKNPAVHTCFRQIELPICSEESLTILLKNFAQSEKSHFAIA